MWDVEYEDAPVLFLPEKREREGAKGEERERERERETCVLAGVDPDEPKHY